jgi:glycosyltransferase involved in cell wall biosynthesis
MFPVSIILSTYDSPEWLEKALWGYAVQSWSDFEIVVADDGSSMQTACLIEQVQRDTKLTLRHVWQEHKGFRKCRILNRAIAAASGSYLIFSDGDCIPRPDFVAQHVRLAKPGRFLSGGLVRLPGPISQQITQDDILSGRAYHAGWLRKLGMPLTPKLRFLAVPPRLAWLFDRVWTTRATFNGCNSSVWKDDVLRVNGFDERMHYGGLDRELGERLVNAGVRPKQIRHRTTCLHLDHQRGYAQPDLIAFNQDIRRTTRQQGRTWTPYGLGRAA